LIHVQLCDLGLCAAAGHRAAGEGTPVYRSPEQELPTGIVAPAADVWSGGVTACQLWARGPWRSAGPSSATSVVEELRSEAWSQKNLAWMPHGLEYVVKLITETLRTDPAHRPTASACAELLRPILEVGGQPPERRVLLGAVAAQVTNLRLQAYYTDLVKQDPISILDAFDKRAFHKLENEASA
jgi:serine/threonine protein kinase